MLPATWAGDANPEQGGGQRIGRPRKGTSSQGVDRGCKCGDSMTAGARPSASEVLSAIYGELTIPMVHINGKASGPLLASGFRPLAE